MPAVRFDEFYRYTELTSLLQARAAERPDRFKLASIGKSFEDRDIWLATVINYATGPDTAKPAFFIEANIHAVEVTGCTAALHLIDKLFTQYGVDEKVTRVMDTRAFYIISRLNPDGAEWALADRPRFIPSSVRPYPRTDQQDGLIEEDLDGDGRILMMRVRDPHGAWKPYPADPRLLVPLAEREIALHSNFAIFHLRISPKMEVHTIDAKPVGEGTYHVRLLLCNTGWLPTNVTQKAFDRKAVRPIEVELALPEGGCSWIRTTRPACT